MYNIVNKLHGFYTALMSSDTDSKESKIFIKIK